ncbi:retroviral-like aspartic protease family protein [Rhodopila globiformis]|nr:retroviral-like aspartic protease family protein [Rhodopila globiformis]
MPLPRLLALVLLMALARCAAPATDCSLAMVARMPLEVQDHLLVVPAGINGQWVRLVVDSGAERTTISNTVAERLGLPHDLLHQTRAVGIGGPTVTNDVIVKRLVIGGVHFPVDRIAVGNFNLQNKHGLDADGLLGADILLAFDMDIDVPGGQLTLYRPRQCPEAAPPWTQPAMEITGVGVRKDRLLLPFQLDGTAGMAILDTGAGQNLIGLDMARRLGLDAQVMANDTTVRNRGIGPVEAVAYLHHFKELRIGPTTQAAPVLAVQLADAGFGDALIGESFLHGRRVWISFRSRRVFVSKREGEE